MSRFVANLDSDSEETAFCVHSSESESGENGDIYVPHNGLDYMEYQLKLGNKSKKRKFEVRIEVDNDMFEDKKGGSVNHEGVYYEGDNNEVIEIGDDKDGREVLEEKEVVYQNAEDVLGVIAFDENDIEEETKNRRQSRYFDPIDLSTKCYNCGKTGHISAKCPEPKFKSCYLCGKLNHSASACPFDVCYKCGLSGHRSVNCIEKSKQSICLVCGSDKHLELQVKSACTETLEVYRLRCMVCGEIGHIDCAFKCAKSNKNPAGCINCSSKLHDISLCKLAGLTKSLFDLGWSINDAIFAGGDRGPSRSPTEILCHRCNESGHIAKNCPVNSSILGDGGSLYKKSKKSSNSPQELFEKSVSTALCFVCNKPGHFAKECPKSFAKFEPASSKNPLSKSATKSLFRKPKEKPFFVKSKDTRGKSRKDDSSSFNHKAGKLKLSKLKTPKKK